MFGVRFTAFDFWFRRNREAVIRPFGRMTDIACFQLASFRCNIRWGSAIRMSGMNHVSPHVLAVTPSLRSTLTLVAYHAHDIS